MFFSEVIFIFSTSPGFSRNMAVSVTPLPQHQLTPLNERGGVCSSACAWAPFTVIPLLKVAVEAMAAGCQAGRISRVLRQKFHLCWIGSRRLAVTCCRVGVTGSCTWIRHCSYTCLSRMPPRWDYTLLFICVGSVNRWLLINASCQKQSKKSCHTVLSSFAESDSKPAHSDDTWYMRWDWQWAGRSGL